MMLALRGGEMKIDAVTDEFVTLSKTTDVMAKLNAVVKGSMDASYNIVDDDINQREKPLSTVSGAVEGKYEPQGEKASKPKRSTAIVKEKANAAQERNHNADKVPPRKICMYNQSRKRKVPRFRSVSK
jgi:hypothetical protein